MEGRGVIKNRSGQKLPDLFPTQKTTEDKNVPCAVDALKKLIRLATLLPE
jgi:hypothetical protein